MRRSKIEPTITTFNSRGEMEKRSVVGPGMVSARSKVARSSSGRNTASGRVPARRRSARLWRRRRGFAIPLWRGFHWGRASRPSESAQPEIWIASQDHCNGAWYTASSRDQTASRAGFIRYRRHPGPARRTAPPRRAGPRHTAGHWARYHHRRHPGTGHAGPGHSDRDDAYGGRLAEGHPPSYAGDTESSGALLPARVSRTERQTLPGRGAGARAADAARRAAGRW